MVKIVSWLGEIPKDIKDLNKEELLSYFSYVYEYSFDKNIIKDNCTIQKYLENFLVNLEDFNISNEKIWWGLTLLTFMDLACNNELSYIQTVIKKIYNDLEYISADELENYCNNINSILLVEISKGLIVRPFEIEKLCKEKSTYIKNINNFINIKDKVITLLENNLNDDDLNMTYINNMLLANKEQTCRYSPLIKQYAELLLTLFNNIYESYQKPVDKNKINIIIDEFLEVSINNYEKNNFHDLKDELVEMIMKVR